MSLNKRRHDVYVDRPLIADHGETATNGFRPGRAPEPLLKDAEIEKDEYRLRLLEGEGDISIIVRPGEELGEIQIAVQFEGERGAWDRCLTRQGELLADVQKWLAAIYGEFPGQFQMDIISEPCPKGDSRLLGVVGSDVRVEPGPVVTSDPKLGVEQ